MIYLIAVITAVVSYLIGSVNTSIIISRAVSGNDIRNSGSGNAGATNMLRTYGKMLGVITLLTDIIKGVFAVFLAHYVVYTVFPDYVFFNMNAVGVSLYFAIDYIAAMFVVIGHDFPIFFGFRGGKGVATSLGVALILDWKIGLIVAIFAIAIIAITRYVSLGSILGGAAFIIAEVLKQVADTYNFGSFSSASAVQLVCVIVIGGLLIVRHRTNIKRLLNGTENKLGQKKA